MFAPSASTLTPGRGAQVFIARNRFAVWDRTASQIHIRNLQNEITKRCAPPDATTTALFYAGTGMLLCRCEDKVVLFDVQQRTVVSELPTPPVKYVVWNAAMTQVRQRYADSIRIVRHRCIVVSGARQRVQRFD